MLLRNALFLQKEPLHISNTVNGDEKVDLENITRRPPGHHSRNVKTIL